MGGVWQSAARRVVAFRNCERGLHPGVRQIAFLDFADALEYFKVMAGLIDGPEHDHRFQWWAAWKGAGKLRDKYRFVWYQLESHSRPCLDAFERVDLFGAPFEIAQHLRSEVSKAWRGLIL